MQSMRSQSQTSHGSTINKWADLQSLAYEAKR